MQDLHLVLFGGTTTFLLFADRILHASQNAKPWRFRPDHNSGFVPCAFAAREDCQNNPFAHSSNPFAGAPRRKSLCFWSYSDSLFFKIAGFSACASENQRRSNSSLEYPNSAYAANASIPSRSE